MNDDDDDDCPVDGSTLDRKQRKKEKLRIPSSGQKRRAKVLNKRDGRHRSAYNVVVVVVVVVVGR